jgi:hypothetical protein
MDLVPMMMKSLVKYRLTVVFKQISKKDNQDTINLEELITFIHIIRGIEIMT